MKEKLKKTPVLEKWFYTQSPLIITRPALQETAACLCYLAGGYLLSCGKINGQPAPFSLGLIASAGGGLRGLCTLLGAVTGFLTMQPFSHGLEMTSGTILTFVTMYIFSSLWVTKCGWFQCLVPGIMAAAVGSIFLMSRQLTWAVLLSFGQNFLLAGLSPLAFDSLLRGKKRSAASLLAICFFLLGAVFIPLPLGLSLGTIVAVTLGISAAGRVDYATASAMGAAFGAALDVAMGSGGLWTLSMGAGSLLAGAIPGRNRFLKSGVFCLAFLAAALFCGNITPTLGLTLGLGFLCSFLIPPGLIVGREESAIAQSAAVVEQQLSWGQDALKCLYDAIGIDPNEKMEQERQHIFDKAAVKVCRRCTRYNQCWEKNSQETYTALRSALTAILSRGAAVREDFPESFSQECRHLDGLIVALNQELDGIACRNQCRSRNEENRLIVSRSLLHLSRLLEANARQLRSDQRFPNPAYTLRVGVSAKGRRGIKVSGDRGICFHTEDGRVYAILCDGSGTGEAAARESLLAVDNLTALIRSGMSPENAMEFLNGMYILRESGGFATLDVLELSLVTGQGTIYKWGAAPSYIRSGNTVKKVGTAAPPPGLGVGSSCGAEVIRLSLWGGDLVVLVSDGVCGEAVEELIRTYEGGDAKELSALLIAQAEALGDEDDMTAAVLQLEELGP